MIIKISELISKLTEVQNRIGDVPLGLDNGCGISWLEDIRENTCYDTSLGDLHQYDLNMSPNSSEDGITFVELRFDTEF